MKHARESQHGHTNALLIMTSFQLEFLMHSIICCQQHSNCREREHAWRGLETQRAVIGFYNFSERSRIRLIGFFFKQKVSLQISVLVWCLTKSV